MTIDFDIKFKGRIVEAGTTVKSLPNGYQLQADVVRHPGGAAVVAINEQYQVCMIRQYRCILDAWIWEIPAGTIDNEEHPLKTAKREAFEEAGVRASRWQSLGAILSSPGVFTETVHLYLAQELEMVDSQLQADEVLEVHWVDFDECIQRCDNNTIKDAKSAIALYRAWRYIGR